MSARRLDARYDLALLRQAATDLSTAAFSLGCAKWRARRREIWPLMQSLMRADRYLATAQRFLQIAGAR